MFHETAPISDRIVASGVPKEFANTIVNSSHTRPARTRQDLCVDEAPSRRDCPQRRRSPGSLDLPRRSKGALEGTVPVGCR